MTESLNVARALPVRPSRFWPRAHCLAVSLASVGILWRVAELGHDGGYLPAVLCLLVVAALAAHVGGRVADVGKLADAIVAMAGRRP